MDVLVVDVGGTSVRILATGQKEPRRLPSGPTNAYAFVGGFRLWEPETDRKRRAPRRAVRVKAGKTKGPHT
jgi:hypothetical protein